jgi:hypothetical protein
LEEDHKELAEKAKKYLGFELYYELSKYNGKPLEETDVLYKELLTKSEELNKEF